ncbi:phbA, partial [Symbiodinium microadriaticum]
DGGRRAVIFDKINGINKTVVGEGTHFRVPFFQEPIIMDIRDRPRTIHSTTGTKDLQMVNISLRILSRPEEIHLPDIYKTLGVDFDDRVLPSLGNEVLKSVVAQYNAEELLSKRAVIAQQIRRDIVKRAANFHLILDD